MSVLAIDYGRKRIGLAIAQEEMVKTLGTFVNSSGFGNKLKAICRENQVERIVVGMPEGELVGEIKLFAEKIKSISHIPVDFQDETLTSRDALDKMIVAGKRQKERRARIDEFAAALILESYLENKKYV